MDEWRLLTDLRALGVGPGDLLMVHASLRRIGLARMPGGAELLVDALDAAVAPGGTLLMIFGTEYPMDWVNRRPTGRPARRFGAVRPGGGKGASGGRRTRRDVPDAPRYDRQRQSQRKVRARGRDAEALLAGQPWHDYYGPGSPLDRLCASGGRILRMGADPDTVTALHHAEYLADLPAKRRTRWDYLRAGPDGPRHVWTEASTTIRVSPTGRARIISR